MRINLVLSSVLYSVCGSFTKADVDSFKASLFLSHIHSNCKFYTINGIHKIWEWNTIITSRLSFNLFVNMKFECCLGNSLVLHRVREICW